MWQIISNKLTRRQLIIIGLIVVSLIVMLVRGWVISDDTTTADIIEETTPSDVDMEESSSVSKSYADIKGAVQKPGVYELSANMRLLDLIQLAGGLTKEADDKQINQAILVQDQSVFYIPKEGEEISDIGTAQGATSDKVVGEAEGKININTATAAEFEQLSGVGAKKAEAIVSYREEHGSFKAIENLSEVSGIGNKTVERLQDQLTI